MNKYEKLLQDVKSLFPNTEDIKINIEISKKDYFIFNKYMNEEVEKLQKFIVQNEENKDWIFKTITFPYLGTLNLTINEYE